MPDAAQVIARLGVPLPVAFTLQHGHFDEPSDQTEERQNELDHLSMHELGLSFGAPHTLWLKNVDSRRAI